MKYWKTHSLYLQYIYENTDKTHPPVFSKSMSGKLVEGDGVLFLLDTNANLVCGCVLDGLDQLFSLLQCKQVLQKTTNK